MHIVFVVVCTLIGGLKRGSDLLVWQMVVDHCCLLLLVITAYPTTNDDRASRQTKQATYPWASLLAQTNDRLTVSGVMHMYTILYLSCVDTMLAIPCMGLPIISTIIGKWLTV